MMSYSPRSPPDVLAARPNGTPSRIPVHSLVGHKRTGSGRIESKENINDQEGAPVSPKEFLGGSATKPTSPFSPIARPVSRLARNNPSRLSWQASESPHDSQIPRPKTAAPNSNHLNGHSGTGSPMPSPAADSGRRRRQPLGLKAAFQLAEVQESRERSGSSSSSGSIDLRKAFELANAEANRVAVGSPSPAPRSYRRRESMDTRSNQYFGSIGGVDLGQRLKQFDKSHQLGGSNGASDRLFANKGRAAPQAADEDKHVERQPDEDQELPNQGVAEPDAALPSPDFDPLPPVDYEDEDDFGSSPIMRPTNPSPEKSFAWDFDDADFTAGDLQVSDSPRIKPGRINSPPSISAEENTTPPKRTNDKLDKIRQLEIEAANAEIPEEESSLTSRKTNPRLDEIRAREMVALSPRAMAQSKLDEIRAKNAEARSRSSSPEEGRNFGIQSSRERPWSSTKGRENGNVEKPFEARKSISPQHNARLDRSTGPGAQSRGTRESPPSKQYQLDAKDDDDLLRRLTEATSPPQKNSPQTWEHHLPVAPAIDEKSKEPEQHYSRPLYKEDQTRDMRAKSLRDRVGFNLSSVHKEHAATSETDPVDRIEAEMDLFALAKSQSEKSSQRAPSPGPSERSEPIEETPKQIRVDPLTLPTPRVMGAYVETPATVKVKVERDFDWSDVDSDTADSQTKIIPKQREDPKESKPKHADSSDSSNKGKVTRRGKRRAKRRLPVVNTAKIPTVKEDLRSIKRQNHIEDSTLDDFDDLLDNLGFNLDEQQQLDDDTIKSEEDFDAKLGLTEQEREQLAYVRMSKSLKTGLQGIRSAKQGIERLEDSISQHKLTRDHDLTDIKTPGVTILHHPPISEPYVALPILYHRDPKFRLTPLGLFTLLVAIWYTIESVFCSLYVDTYECPRGMVCDWSPNEPYFPYATPFMLDEWISGGKGRALVWRVGEEIGDAAAEVADWATGHDFTQDEVMYMNIWDRRRHRRRLHKRGLHRKWIEPIQHKFKFQAWRDSWNERQREIDEGIPVWEDESMFGDEAL